MPRKVLTRECPSCKYCSVNDNSAFICSWGKGREKVMESPKGKKVIHCNLIKKGE